MPASDREAGRRAECPQGQRAYAGIGSRQTPSDVLALMESVAARLAGQGWVLRSGASPGADQALYRGARGAGGRVELYLPWPDFEADSWSDADPATVSVLARPIPEAYELAARFHPGWGELGPQERHLLARDGHEVLGADLASPAGLVVCWTADGSVDGEGVIADGTGQALRIAREHGIAAFNLARAEHVLALTKAQPDSCVC